MNIKVTFRGMDHSDSIEQYLRDGLKKVLHFLQNEHEPIVIECMLEAARQHHHHKVEILLKSKHYHCVVVHEAPELYPLIDYALKVVVDDIKKQKDKAIDKRNHPKDLPLKDEFEE